MGLTVADSSVLIAALDADDSLHRSAVDVLAESWDRGDQIIIPAVAYAETMVRPVAAGGALLSRAEEFFAELTVAPLTREAARQAAALRAAHRWLRTPDALIIASAAQLAADRLVTGDDRWLRADPRVEVIAPA